MLTKKKIKNIKPGQWIRVFWDDIGVRDVVAITSGKEALENNPGMKTNYLEVLDPGDGRHTIDFDQIVAISGIRIRPPQY